MVVGCFSGTATCYHHGLMSRSLRLPVSPGDLASMAVCCPREAQRDSSTHQGLLAARRLPHAQLESSHARLCHPSAVAVLTRRLEEVLHHPGPNAPPANVTPRSRLFPFHS